MEECGTMVNKKTWQNVDNQLEVALYSDGNASIITNNGVVSSGIEITPEQRKEVVEFLFKGA